MDDDEIRAAYAEGGSGTEMAERLGCSRATLYRRLARLGLPPPGRQGEDLSEMLHTRVSLEDLAEIDRRADARGLTVSEYVRAAALGRLEPAG